MIKILCALLLVTATSSLSRAFVVSGQWGAYPQYAGYQVMETPYNEAPDSFWAIIGGVWEDTGNAFGGGMALINHEARMIISMDQCNLDTVTEYFTGALPDTQLDYPLYVYSQSAHGFVFLEPESPEYWHLDPIVREDLQTAQIQAEQVKIAIRESLAQGHVVIAYDNSGSWQIKFPGPGDGSVTWSAGDSILTHEFGGVALHYGFSKDGDIVTIRLGISKAGQFMEPVLPILQFQLRPEHIQ